MKRHILPFALLLLPGCPDDAEEGTSGDSASTTGTDGSVSMTGSASTSTTDATMSGSSATTDETTSGPEPGTTSETTSGSTTDDTDDSTDDTGRTAGSDSETGFDPLGCLEIEDQEACEDMNGCEWNGMGQGMCIPQGARDLCEMQADQQSCEALPACEWDDEEEQCQES